MAYIKLPGNMNAVALEGKQFNADENGIIKVDEDLVTKVLSLTRGTVVTADAIAALIPAKPIPVSPITPVSSDDVKMAAAREKIMADLTSAGIKFDRRWSLENLQAALAQAIEEQRKS